MNRRAVTLLAPLTALLLHSAIAYAQAPVSIDVKTKWAEKPALTAAKNGAELMLLESGWASIVELGEDYSLWLRSLGRQRKGDSVIVTIGVELRAPSMFEEGDLFGKRVVSVTYAADDDWVRHGTPEAVSVVREIEKYADVAVLVARAIKPGEMFAIEKSWNMLRTMMPDELLHVRLEAMVAGLKVAAAARDLVEEARVPKAVGPVTSAPPRRAAPATAAGSANGRIDTSVGAPAASARRADATKTQVTDTPAVDASAKTALPAGTADRTAGSDSAATTTAAVPGGE